MAVDAYPLAAARTLGQREEEDATTALAAVNAALRAAEQRTTAAREQVARHDRETTATLAAERARDAAPRSAADAGLAGAWARRRRDERQQLVTIVQSAAREERTAHDAVEAARVALAHARAEREAVEKHHGRWLAERRKLAEGRADAEVEDVIAGRRR